VACTLGARIASRFISSVTQSSPPWTVRRGEARRVGEVGRSSWRDAPVEAASIHFFPSTSRAAGE
jgi:hypothetical protein